MSVAFSLRRMNPVGERGRPMVAMTDSYSPRPNNLPIPRPIKTPSNRNKQEKRSYRHVGATTGRPRFVKEIFGLFLLSFFGVDGRPMVARSVVRQKTSCFLFGGIGLFSATSLCKTHREIRTFYKIYNPLLTAGARLCMIGLHRMRALLFCPCTRSFIFVL